MLLLGYLGVLSSPELEPYLELGSALKRYAESLRSGLEGSEALKETILNQVAELSRTRALSPRRRPG